MIRTKPAPALFHLPVKNTLHCIQEVKTIGTTARLHSTIGSGEKRTRASHSNIYVLQQHHGKERWHTSVAYCSYAFRIQKRKFVVRAYAATKATATYQSRPH